jgi:hypothetical protein
MSLSTIIWATWMLFSLSIFGLLPADVELWRVLEVEDLWLSLADEERWLFLPDEGI